MTYVISDIHGCYKKYRSMLEIIEFTGDDYLLEEYRHRASKHPGN